MEGLGRWARSMLDSSEPPKLKAAGRLDCYTGLFKVTTACQGKVVVDTASAGRVRGVCIGSERYAEHICHRRRPPFFYTEKKQDVGLKGLAALSREKGQVLIFQW